MKKHTLLISMILAATAGARAQTTDLGKDVTIPGPPVQAAGEPLRSLELSAGQQSLSDGYGHWRDVNLRGTYGLARHTLQAELSSLRRFNEDGAFLGISDTYTFNEDWFGSVAVGAGDGAFYLPKVRVDTALYKKWLADRSLVTSVGLGYYDAPDGHTDRSLTLGAAYYFTSPWIVEGGVRLNRSSPGSVNTHQPYVAVTYGRHKQDLVSARYTWGSEGYLAIAANTQLVNFKSEEASIAWRHWLNDRTGLLVSANRYRNPSYHRSGINIGIFHDF